MQTKSLGSILASQELCSWHVPFSVLAPHPQSDTVGLVRVADCRVQGAGSRSPQQPPSHRVSPEFVPLASSFCVVL